MTQRASWTALALMLTGAALLLHAGGPAPAALAQGPKPATYRVTLVNLTSGQPFSPPVAATHQKSIRMFQVGRLATDELAAIAQDGNQLSMAALFDASRHVTEVEDIGAPVLAGGSVTFEVVALPGDKFSLATMLICTNDGFLGLDAVALPHSGTATFLLNGYDAGREQNTEASQDIVDPCSAIGPVPLAGDPDGNEDAAVATSPAQDIHHHPGILGVGDLTTAAHGWIDPVARVTIERLN